MRNNTALYIVGGTAGTIVLLLAIFGIAASGSYNGAVSLENRIIAAADDNEQYLGQFYNTLDESVQVTEMYADDFRDIATGMLEGRYGEDGSQATFQFIREEMPMISPEMYRELQLIVQSNRDGYRNKQRVLLDLRRQYENKLYSFPSNVFMGMFGFPKRVDLDDPRFNVSSTEDARTTRETGIEAPRQIGGE